MLQETSPALALKIGIASDRNSNIANLALQGSVCWRPRTLYKAIPAFAIGKIRFVFLATTWTWLNGRQICSSQQRFHIRAQDFVHFRNGFYFLKSFLRPFHCSRLVPHRSQSKEPLRSYFPEKPMIPSRPFSAQCGALVISTEIQVGEARRLAVSDVEYELVPNCIKLRHGPFLFLDLRHGAKKQ